MNEHLTPGVSGAFSLGGFVDRAGEMRDERLKRHKDMSCNLEYYGAERAWVVTTGLAVGDFPWPALVVPEPREFFLPKGFHAPAFAETHVVVMLLGVGDTRRHSEYQWFRYVRKASHVITSFSAASFENWLPKFCERLVEAGARSGDPLVAADGLDAAFRMVDKFPSRKEKEPLLDNRTAADAQSLRLRFLALARRAAALALGPDVLQTVKFYPGGVRAFLAQRNVSLEHVEYDFSSARALLGEESARSFFLPSSDDGTEFGFAGDDDDPARLLVAAACACAERAAGHALGVSVVSPLRLGGAPLASPINGVSESSMLGRALASLAPSPAARASFAPAAVGATALASLIAQTQARASLLAARHFSNASASAATVAAASPLSTASPAFASNALSPLSQTPFFATSASGYDPLEISMVPTRRLGASPIVAGLQGLNAGVNTTPVGATTSSLLFGSHSARLNTRSGDYSASQIPVATVASRLKIEDADDVLDEGDKVLSPKVGSPKGTPKTSVPCGQTVDRTEKSQPNSESVAASLFGAEEDEGAVAVEAGVGGAAAPQPQPAAIPPAPAPAAIPLAPAPASKQTPCSDDSALNGVSTPLPDAEKDAEAAKKAKRREYDRLRRLKNKAEREEQKKRESLLADSTSPIAETQSETVRSYSTRTSQGEGKRAANETTDVTTKEAEGAGKEDDENLPVLEMEEAQLVIARLVNSHGAGNETEPGATNAKISPRNEKTRVLRKTLRSAFARAPRALASSDEQALRVREEPIEDRTEVVPYGQIVPPEKKPYAPPPRFEKKYAPDFSAREAYPLPPEPRGSSRDSPSPGKEPEDERKGSGSPGSPGESPAGSLAGSPGRKIRLLRDIYGEDWDEDWDKGVPGPDVPDASRVAKPGARNARGKRQSGKRKSVSPVSVERPSERASPDAAQTCSDAPPRRSRSGETAKPSEPSPSEPSPSEPSPSERTDFKRKPRVVVDDDEGALDAAAKPLSKKRRSGAHRGKKPANASNRSPSVPEPKPEPKEPKEPKDPKEPTKRVSSSKAPKKARDPTSPLTMAPAPKGSIFASSEDAHLLSPVEKKKRAAEKKRFEAKRYRCAVFECDREKVGDFQVTRHGDAGEVNESLFCEIALGVTPERLLRLKGMQPGSYYFKQEKTRALCASLFTFGERDATDEEATAFANAFVTQGGMVVRHFMPSDDGEKSLAKPAAGDDGLDGNAQKRADASRSERSASRKSSRRGVSPNGDGSTSDEARAEASAGVTRAAEAETWTTWSGRRTTVKSALKAHTSRPVRRKPAPDLGPWLASLRRAHKGESVSETCFYVSQRLVPKFKAKRRSVPRLPKDADGNPVEGEGEGERNKKEGDDRIDSERNGTYYDSDDDAVAPSETLGFVEVVSATFVDPAKLLATPTEVAYLGIKQNEGSGLPLYAAYHDAERLNRKKTPTFSLFSSRGSLETKGDLQKSDNDVNDEKTRREKEEEMRLFHASVLSLDDVLFDAASQGSEMWRDMRLAERETFSLMHNRSGMPLRFRYLEFDISLCVKKIEQQAQLREREKRGGLFLDASVEKDGVSPGRDENGRPSKEKDGATKNIGATETKARKSFFGVEAEKPKRDEPSHAWDPRLLSTRPGNVARYVAATCFANDDRAVDEIAAPTLRFFAAGAVVPLSTVRPLALSEVAYAYATTGSRKKRVYQTDTTSKKVLDASGFVWYTVAKSDVPKLAQYLRETCALAGEDAFFAGDEKRHPKTTRDAKSRSLLDSDSCDLKSPGLWLDPGAIARWNASKEHKRDRVVVQRHVQRVGEHFARAPGAARWGVCVGGCWLAETRFAFPEDYNSLLRDAEETEKKAAFDGMSFGESSVTEYRVPKDASINSSISGVNSQTGKALLAEALLLRAAAAAAKIKD